jgi:hypothetical protein
MEKQLETVFTHLNSRVLEMGIYTWYILNIVIVYFDECYDSNHDFLILGALFNPRHKAIYDDFKREKRRCHFVNSDGRGLEIKYTKSNTRRNFIMALRAVDCFINSQSYFRAIVVDQRQSSGFNLDYFGKPYETKTIKNARAYKVFSELLLRDNISRISNGVLLTDRLTRCSGDECLDLIMGLFGTPNQKYSSRRKYPIFRHVQEVDTALETYHVGQIGDILQGVILNELVPSQNKYKRKLREYVKQQLSIPSLDSQYWQSLNVKQRNQLHPKYQAWHWKPSP